MLDVIQLIHSNDGGMATDLARSLATTGLDFHFFTDLDQGLAFLSQISAAGWTPLLVIIDARIPDPTGVAVQANRLAPHAHIALLATNISAHAARNAMPSAVAALTTFIDPQTDDLSLLLGELERERQARAVREDESGAWGRWLSEHALLIETIPDIVWTSRIDGSRDYFNRRWFDYTGFSREQSEGWGWRRAVHPDDLSRCVERWEQAVQDNGTYEFEHRLRRSDGLYRWYLERAVPMRGEPGGEKHWLGTCTDIDADKRAQDLLHFLHRADRALAQSLDYETTLKNVARFALDFLADWCIVDLVDDRGVIERIKIAHKDSAKEALAQQLHRRYSTSTMEVKSIPEHVIRTGRAALVPEISDAMLESVAQDDEHLALLRSLGLHSYMSVPLEAHGRVFGALSFVRSAGARRYQHADLGIAEDLARRCALAVDNARLYKTAQDEIAVRTRTEQALRETEARLRPLVDSNVIGVIFHDVSSDQIVEANDAFLQMIGHTQEDLATGRVLWRALTPVEYRAADERALEECRRKGACSPYEKEFIRKNETRVRALVGAACLEAGCRRRICFVLDLTERKRTEDALRHSEALFRLVTDMVPVLIVYIDADQRYRFISRQYEKWFGQAPMSVYGKHLREVLGEDAYVLVRSYVQDALKGKEVTFESTTKFGDGQSHRMRATYVPDVGEDGRVRGLVGLVSDITVQRRIEEQLLKTQKLESLGLLAGGIAHDFNNILTIILGNVSLAKLKAQPSNGAYEGLSDAEVAIERARDLTRQLLTFSQGGAPIRKAGRISDVIREAARFALRGSNVKADLTVPGDLWLVKFDPNQISQALNNLIINAVQAMPTGGVVRINAENFSLDGKYPWLPLPAGRYVRIAIEDQGIGIPREHLSKIFDPYFTTKQSGSGLGLATAYSIMKRHEGYIEVKSKLGVGTTFFLYLPASEEAAATRPESTALMRGEGRILIMDDEEAVRRVAGELVHSLGYEVELAADGAEAVRFYQDAMALGRPFSAVIMDLTVPAGMGGKDCMQRLREIDPEVKGIVSSGYSNDPIMANFEKYGFRGVVAKPYQREELGRALWRVLTISTS